MSPRILVALATGRTTRITDHCVADATLGGYHLIPALKGRAKISAATRRILGANEILTTLECVVEISVPAIQRHGSPVNKEMTNVSSRLQQISIGDNQVRHFTNLNRAEPVGHVKDLRWIKSDCFQSLRAC